MRSIWAALAGSVSRPLVTTTTSAVSPAWAGNLVASRCWARWAAELPPEKLLLKALPDG